MGGRPANRSTSYLKNGTAGRPKIGSVAACFTSTISFLNIPHKAPHNSTNAVVKRGFVLNSDVFVESSTKFLYIFKRQIRNWPPEEHVSLASGNFRLDSEIGKDDTPSGVPKCRSIAVSPAIAGRRSR